MNPPFFGKYRGVVTNNKDPLLLGRVQARVPDVLGDTETGWATACMPFGGPTLDRTSAAGFFAVPNVGAGVWIEFEHGDPDYPVWTGCWLAAPVDVPSEVLAPPYVKSIIKTPFGHSLIFDDTPGAGGITIQTKTGQKISVTSLGIEISNGVASIKLVGPLVQINNDGLVVK